MKNVLLLGAAMCVLQMSSVALAANATWNNGSGDQDWANGANWSIGVPTGGDEAHINSALPAAIVSDVRSIGRVVLDNTGTLEVAAGGNLTNSGQLLAGNGGGSQGNLVVDGQFSAGAEFAIGTAGGGAGTMTVGAMGTASAVGPWLIAGFGGGTNGTIDVNGGTVNVSGFMGVGWDGIGALNVNGGLVDVTGVINVGVNNPAAHGDIVINAGEISSAGLNLGNNVGSGSLLMEDGTKYTNLGGFVQSAGSTVTINGSAEFEFTASPLSDIEALVLGNPDWIFSGTPSVAGSLGSVIVTNVPEPTAMVMFGMGVCLTLCRRQRTAR